MPTDLLASALDQLLAAPLDDFVPLRKKLVAELRAAKDAPAARQLAATAKPTRTAWALNQVARRQPAVFTALFEAREAAEARGDAEHLRRTTREYRDRLNDVVRAAHDVLAEVGVELNVQQSRRVAETLQAACAGEGDVRARLVAGTLTEDVSLDDPFGAMTVGADEAAPEAPHAAPVRTAMQQTHETDEQARALARKQEEERQEQERREQERRQRALQAAQDRVTELEEAARVAVAKVRAADAVAVRAATMAQQAKEAADGAQAELEAARVALERLPAP
jgi:hypothetical protein